MRTIANEIVTALAGVPEVYHEINRRPAPLVYPYIVFDYSYEPVEGHRNKYTVTVEFDLFGNGPDATDLLDLEETLVDRLARYRAMSDDAWSMATLDLAAPLDTLVEGLHRRHLQFSIGMTLRKKG